MRTWNPERPGRGGRYATGPNLVQASHQIANQGEGRNPLIAGVFGRRVPVAAGAAPRSRMGPAYHSLSARRPQGHDRRHDRGAGAGIAPSPLRGDHPPFVARAGGRRPYQRKWSVCHVTAPGAGGNLASRNGKGTKCATRC